MNKKTSFHVAEKTVTLYVAEQSDSPLIVLNNFTGDGSSVVEMMGKIGCKNCHLISVGNLRWDHDMTPWYCPPLSSDDTPCTGGADAYLESLLNGILPETLSRISGTPKFIGITGYSLAGLFALYAMYHTDRFSRAASMSGSLWFPDFKEYAISHDMMRAPDKLYFSLGDKEAKTRNPILKTVQDNTEYLVKYYRDQEIDTEYELNEGNHYKDAALRSAKGIAALLN